jgi:hypothetical protein
MSYGTVKMIKKDTKKDSHVVTCDRCIIDDSIPGIVFDTNHVCNYCKWHDGMDLKYPINTKLFDDLIDRIKKDGTGKEYDAVIGVSGGCDSSYLLSLMHDEGLRLLAVHMDNGWDTIIAERNIKRMTKVLDVPLQTVKVDLKVFDSLCRSFLLAGTPDADIPNDLCLLDVVQQVALDNDIHWNLSGHSFRTEGTAPLGWTYMDGGYLEDVNKRFEDIDLGDFPHLSWDKQKEYWDYGLHNIRPLYHIDYNKENTINYLIYTFGWEWYKGLHAENIYTKFVGRYLWPRKFGIDYRRIEYSALIRSDQINRTAALDALKKEPVFESEYLDMIKKRLLLTDKDLDSIMDNPVHNYKEFNNYLPRFRDPENRAYFVELLADQKIPCTFYNKYIEGI